MPKLVRLYVINVAIGFGISALFLGVLLAFDVAHLRHLILNTPLGWLAGLMIFFSTGTVFAGVQFAIRIMGMAEREDSGPRGGLREPSQALLAAPALATQKPRR